MTKPVLLAALLALPLGACATSSSAPVEVTRFHVADPARSGTLAVEEMPGNPDVSLEFQSYAGIVGQAFQRAGFTPSSGGASDYVALVSLNRSFRPTGIDNSSDRPVSVGVGGGFGSGGGRRGGSFGGLGVGVGISLSGKPKDIVLSQMQIQLRRRSDSTVVWEGRASTQARQGSPAAQPVAAAQKLADALVGGYPGESGRTITVK